MFAVLAFRDQTDDRFVLILGRSVNLVVLIVAGMLGFVEAAGAIAYYVVVPRQQREAVEFALGIETPDFNSVLRYRPHPYLNHLGNPDYVTLPSSRTCVSPLGSASNTC